MDISSTIGIGNIKVSRVTLQAKDGATTTINGDHGNITVTIKNDITDGFSIVLDGKYAGIIRIVGYR